MEDNNRICACRTCNGIVHEVKKGDTLYLLSRYYNVGVSDIIRENRGVNPYNLMVGDTLCIPVRNYMDYTSRYNYNNETNQTNQNGQKNQTNQTNQNTNYTNRMNTNRDNMNFRNGINNNSTNNPINIPNNVLEYDNDGEEGFMDYEIEFQGIDEKKIIDRNTKISELLKRDDITIEALASMIKEMQ